MVSSGPSFEEIRNSQRQHDVDFVDAYRLPQLPDNRDEIYERLLMAERQFSPNLTLIGYDAGTARVENEMQVRDGTGALLTAEHATTRWQLEKNGDRRVRQGADTGTGGLGTVLAEDMGAAFIAPLGRQTMDANHDVHHSLKDRVRTFLVRPDIGSAVSLHRMFLGRVASLADARGFNLVFGIGPSPSPETVSAVDSMLEIAKKYDLRAGVNQPLLRYESDGVTPRKTADGSFDTVTFAASGEGTTRTFAQQAAQALGKPLIAMQIEISQANLVFSEDQKYNPGRQAQTIGTYLTYLFMKESQTVLTGAGE